MFIQIVRESNLKILGVVEKDTGVYQCIASKPVGNVQASAQLLVLPKGTISKILKLSYNFVSFIMRVFTVYAFYTSVLFRSI